MLSVWNRSIMPGVVMLSVVAPLFDMTPESFLFLVSIFQSAFEGIH